MDDDLAGMTREQLKTPFSPQRRKGFSIKTHVFPGAVLAVNNQLFRGSANAPRISRPYEEGR